MANKTNIAGTTSGDNVKLDNVILEVYSEEILFEANPVLRFEQIAVLKQDLTVLPGQKIKFLKYNALDEGDTEIAETADLETGTISTATLQIQVGERGKALKFSEALLKASVTDVLSDAAKLLGAHYAKVRDSMVRDALQGSPNVLYAKGNANRAALDSTDTFDVDLIRDAVELLATNKAPKFGGQDYVGFIHPRQAKYLRKDDAWVQANLYGAPENLFKGEIGKMEDMRFIETTQVAMVKKGTQQIWVDRKNSGKTTSIAANGDTDVYLAIGVGEYAVGIAESLPAEMRDDGVINFGRFHAIAWYGIFGAGLLETGHSVVLESA